RLGPARANTRTDAPWCAEDQTCAFSSCWSRFDSPPSYSGRDAPGTFLVSPSISSARSTSFSSSSSFPAFANGWAPSMSLPTSQRLAPRRGVLAAAVPTLNPGPHPLQLRLNAELRAIPGDRLLDQRLSGQELVIGRGGFLTEGAVPEAPGEILACGAHIHSHEN